MDFEQVTAHVHQYNGSRASVGAARVKKNCATFRNLCFRTLKGEFLHILPHSLPLSCVKYLNLHLQVCFFYKNDMEFCLLINEKDIASLRIISLCFSLGMGMTNLKPPIKMKFAFVITILKLWG